jgi:hypothetical protein
MRKRILILAAAIAVVICLALTFKIERIGEICSLTGSSQQYVRYFSIIKTKPKFSESWIEQALRSHGEQVPEHHWIRIMGDTQTLSTFSRVHASAPITYYAQGWTIPILRESMDEDHILQLAREFASGDIERQRNAMKILEKQ